MLRQYAALTWMLFKAYVRDRGAIFFSILIPIFITAIFGVLNFAGSSKVVVGVVNEAQNPASNLFIENLKRVDVLDIRTGDRDPEVTALRRGERDIVFVFPSDFAPSPQKSAGITVYEHAGRPQQVQIAESILGTMIDQASFAALQAQPLAKLERQQVDANNLTYVDFLIPGMVAMSIMQLGVFSVAFGLVQFRRTGALRRLMATPLRPAVLLAAQTTVRLVMMFLQVLLLIGIGIVFFKFHLVGSLPELLAVGVLGGLVFLTFGFIIAGTAKTEDQAAPLANMVSMPQMFLSGVFFSTATLPAWLKPIAALFPLTFFADAAREISTQGAHLWDVSKDLAGLAVWLVIGFVAAARFFRYD
ncbi:MAG: hypothetical protein AUH85_10975 [Chloroflexi bacterium 13_1_40CM_4_68_4]|nr:MAG: hypothetical protein AUH85_10975 [Chloroflexi bacterium 13_1_40CM_4_68_4]